MINIKYAMSEALVKKFAETKDFLLNERKKLDPVKVEAEKQEIIKNTMIYDFDAAEADELEDSVFYEEKDGVAQIQVAGMLVNKVDPCAGFFGETLTTYKYIRESVKRAEKDPFVDSIAFLINSSGGNLNGLDMTSQRIFASDKKTTAIILDRADSAAYWLASSCDEILMASRTSEAGSIGICVEFIDRSKADEEAGIKREFLTNTVSSEKIADLTTDEGKKLVVDEMDSVYNVFKETILRKRSDKLTDKKIDELKGRVMIGEEAIDYGLADKMIEADQIMDYLLGNPFLLESAPLNAEGNIIKENFMNDKVSLEQLLSKYPEAKAEYDNEKSAEKSRIDEAVKADRERFGQILNLSGVTIPEDVMADAKSGLTVGDFSAKELEKRNKILTAKPDTDHGDFSAESQLPKKADDISEEEKNLQSRWDKVIDNRLGKKES